MNKLLVDLFCSEVLFSRSGLAGFQERVYNSDNLISHYLAHEAKPATYSENGKPKGYAVDLLKTVLVKMGTNISDDKISIIKWPAAYDTAANEPGMVLFLTKRIPEREVTERYTL